MPLLKHPIQSFEEFLKTGGIPSILWGGGAYTIPGDLDMAQDQEGSMLRSLGLAQSLDVALPDDLTVKGSMSLCRTRIPRLPKHLFVAGHLYMNQCRITSLPAGLSVGGRLIAQRGRLERLPDNLHVPGNLDLRDNPIMHLPKGLRVGGRLDLGGTRVKTFPRDMQVGGTLHPPDDLPDVLAFMHNKPRDVVLSMEGSYHDKMRVRALMAPYPDLQIVLDFLEPGFKLHLQRRFMDRVRVLFNAPVR